MLTALQLAVLAILDHATDYEWSVQGFGVLRLYIRDLGRLHIWDQALRYPNVSMIHNHSWDLESTVVIGELRNTRFSDNTDIAGALPNFWRQRLVTGYQTHMVTEPCQVRLDPWPDEMYGPGDHYTQRAHEIHRTDAMSGTITIMCRDEDENGQADVYWPIDGTWGTAKPRPATRAEVEATVARAMRWFELSHERKAA